MCVKVYECASERERERERRRRRRRRRKCLRKKGERNLSE